MICRFEDAIVFCFTLFGTLDVTGPLSLQGEGEVGDLTHYYCLMLPLQNPSPLPDLPGVELVDDPLPDGLRL